MQDTLANNWRQRMAWRSAACAFLLAVPVAVAAQISFSSGLGNVPFGVSTFAAGPEQSSIGAQAPAARGQNLVTLLDDAGAPGQATAGAPAGGTVASAGTGGGSAPLTGDPVAQVPGPPSIGDPTGASGGGPADAGGPPRDNTTPPVPPPSPPAPSGGSTPPPSSPPAGPVPGVSVPDPGGIVESVTDPVGQAAGLVPGVGTDR